MLLTIFKITTLFIPIFAFGLGIFSLVKNPRSKVIWLWFLLSMAVGVWGLGLFMILFAKTANQALVDNMILNTGSVLIPILFFHFISVFLYKEKRKKSLIFFGYFLAFLFLISVFNPPLFIGGVGAKTGFDFWIDGGVFYIPFLFYFWFYFIFAIYLLFKEYRRCDGLVKKQIFYIIVASIIGFVGGGTTFLPQISGIYPFGSFVTFLYPILITYGIFLGGWKK